MSVSQPLAVTPSQSPKPVLQLPMPHAPAAHTALPLEGVGHTVPQAPQWERSVRVLTSQPLLALPSQSAKPALQLATPHTPAAQLPVALAGLHAMPQPPQWARALRVFTSQPSASMALQSAKPSEHAPRVQTPAVQTAAPLAGAGHAPPQRPQWAALLRVLTSQPLAAIPSQSPKPVSQDATVHAPAAHPATPLVAEQAVPHAPQWLVVTASSTSQPLAASPSQSAKPASQVKVHAPIAQALLAWARAGHATPQPPQWLVLVRVSTSQPLAAMPSQSPKGAVQRATAQTPATQPGSALGAVQAVPQAPQLAGLRVVSTQPPEQQVRPVGQARAASQPGTQTLPVQRVPAGQWSSTTHCTQLWVATLQRLRSEPRPPSAAPASAPEVTRQPWSSWQPATHTLVPAAQCWSLGQVSREGRQATHRPLVASHTRSPMALPAQSGSVRQPVATSGVPVSAGPRSLTTVASAGPPTTL